MHVLTDALGRQWNLELNIGVARRIDSSDYSAISSTVFSVLRPDKKTFLNIMGDRNLLVAIIWTIVQPQVQAQLNLDPADPAAEEEFVSGFNGRVLTEAVGLMWKVLADFFPEHQTVLLNLQQNIEELRQEERQQMESLLPDLMETAKSELGKGMKLETQKLRERLSLDISKMSE